jgi:hypothetical protein
MATPRNVSDVRSFLGTASYYRRFIKDFACISRPLNALLKKNQAFDWTPACDEAVDLLKTCLVSPPILSYPCKDLIQVLTSDASLKGLGAILSQFPADDPTQETVIAYASRSVNGPETRYSATHLEALGVVWAVNHFRHYLSGRHFKLRTDHSALVYIFKPAATTPKILRWSATLMEYDFEMQYRRGSENPADALSRLIDPPT